MQGGSTRLAILSCRGSIYQVLSVILLKVRSKLILMIGQTGSLGGRDEVKMQQRLGLSTSSHGRRGSGSCTCTRPRDTETLCAPPASTRQEQLRTRRPACQHAIHSHHRQIINESVRRRAGEVITHPPSDMPHRPDHYNEDPWCGRSRYIFCLVILSFVAISQPVIHPER